MFCGPLALFGRPAATSGPRRKPVTVALVAAACLLAGGSAFYCAAVRADVRLARDLRRLTGAHTRIVWVQQQGTNAADVFAFGSDLKLMGFDTDDGRGIHALLRVTGNYRKPLITPQGDRIVVTDYANHKILVLGWDGSKLREIEDGVAAAVWMDPTNGTEWVLGFRAAEMAGDKGRTLLRIQLDHPEIRETVWEGADLDMNNIQLSADGKCMAGLFPWPQVGIADLASGTWRQLGRGCWVSFAPDNSRLLWELDDSHRSLTLHAGDGAKHWSVRLGDAPGIDGAEVYHPRWSNNVRILCMTGPYGSIDGKNQIRAGGRDVDVYVGRFNAQLTSVEEFVRVTCPGTLDVFPDVWVEPAAVRW